MINEIIKEFENKKIVILGFGKEGKSSYHFLRRYLDNIPLVIADKNENIINDESLKSDKNVSFILGDNYLDNLEDFDIILKSPGISFKDIDTSKIKDKISSQIQILLKYYRTKVIGITGTKGKSTTSSLIYDIIKNNQKKGLLLGNIGNPIFDYIEELEQQEFLVVELSSHQLEFVTYSPHISIITNFYEDHLDHTKSVEDYYKSKLNIVKYQNDNDYLIYYKGSSKLDTWINKTIVKATTLSVDFDNTLLYTYCSNNYIYVDKKKIYNINDKRNLIGNHNLINVMLALTVSKILNLDNEKSIKAINNFKPLEHRLELVGTYDGITYYNDSIATIPDATINGIKALGQVNTLIFGGLNRGIDYSEFIEYLDNADIDNLICMPTTGHMIAKELKKTKGKNIYIVDTLEEAVKRAKEVTKKGTICLMSPAAASYEYFKNFEEKGNRYKELVKKEK